MRPKALLVLFLILFTAAPLMAGPPQRIVSLAPSVTEILFSLGLKDNIAGVTDFCDFPEEAKLKPKVGGMVNPSIEAIVRLMPDIVVMTRDGNPPEIEYRLKDLGIKTYVIKERRLSELPLGIKNLSAALSVEKRGEELARSIEKTLEGIKTKTPGARPLLGRPGNPSERMGLAGPGSPTALFIVWHEPLVVAGKDTAIGDAMALLGLKNIADDAMGEYPRYSIEEVLRKSPDVIFIGSMGETRELSKPLLEKLKTTKAVKTNKVYYVSERLLRLSPRFIQGIEEMEEFLEE